MDDDALLREDKTFERFVAANTCVFKRTAWSPVLKARLADP
jgi:hypothetical protein